MSGPALSARVAALVVLASAALTGMAAGPAQAAGGVTVDAAGQGAVIDSTYSTELRVRGSGFQSIKGGHGGVYVWFGTVNGKWQPSKGGQSGVNYVYVPDKESKDNAGFQRYVAFPGSSTASAANGGVMSGKGAWEVRLMVPGPEFEAVGRNGEITRVDCRKVTCGVITIGAHGVKNANNETFTPVELGDLSETGAVEKPDTSGTRGSGAGGAGAAVPRTDAAPAGSGVTESGSGDRTGVERGATGPRAAKKGPAELSVDHAAAFVGRAMSFAVTGLTPGEQFTAVLDDGLAAAGPFVAGDDGGASGLIGLPASTEPGTHELRLYGASKEVSMKFGVAADPGLETVSVRESDEQQVAALVFAVVAAVIFLSALFVTIRRTRRGRRARA
ncbi:hypothetical protein [Nocardioides gilvus]|uniref:hypothetical protein n=1 Tax=Nocardioides gilvus TaxID=1735589 RepID=UPI000D74F989|nr:hypothetical protein [Nocardioides gilvus]